MTLAPLSTRLAAGAHATVTPADVVPDVAGLSAREAARTLVRLGLMPRLTGDGFVLSQTPPAGTGVDPGAEIRLVLGRLQARRDQDATPKP